MLLWVLLAATALAAEPPGIAPGGRIPAFSAPDQNGQARDFASLRGPNGAVLVFYRSADW